MKVVNKVGFDHTLSKGDIFKKGRNNKQEEMKWNLK